MSQLGIQVSVLGPLAVSRDGRPVGPEAGAAKPRRLLCTLAINANRVLSKDVLVERLWDTPPPTARNLVEKYVSRWRKALGSQRLETVRDGYRLNLRAGECDLLDVENLLAQARTAARRGEEAAAAEALDRAIGPWRPAGADRISDCAPEQEEDRLLELYLTTLGHWARATLTAGDADPRLVERLSGAFDRHPLREDLAEALMWALVRQGRQQEAIECYERVRRTLAAELGQDPGAALQQFHLRVLRQDPALHGGPRRPARLDNLPPRNVRFAGRGEQLDSIHALLRTCPDGSGARAVALWGVVGGGKTALALEYAHRHRGEYDCIWWVDATTSASTAAGLEALASVLGCVLPAERDTYLYQLWDELRRFRTTLVIFDNASDASTLLRHLPAGGDVLITSLNPEWRRVAEPLAVDVLSARDSHTLLRARIATSSPGAEAQLVADLGRLPLAMSQAAAYIEQTGMRVDDYLPLFRRRRAQLLQRGVPDDHQSTIDTTWRLAQAELSAAAPAAVELLALCSLLSGENIPLELITADPALLPAELGRAAADELELEDVIRQARRYSLLARNGNRLQMHCLVQSVIASSLSPAERADWRRRAAACLIARAPVTVDASAQWPRWEFLVPHVRAVAREFQATDATDTAEPELIALIQRAAGYLSHRAEFGEALAMMRIAQRLIEATAPAADDVTVGRGLTELGTVLEQNDRLAEALEAHRSALAILRREAGTDDPWVARAVGGLNSVMTCHSGVTLWKPGDLEEAEAEFVRVLATLTATLGERDPVVARALAGLGQVRQDRGDAAAGRDCFERALDIMRSVYGPDHPDVGHCQDKLAYALALCGDIARSKACYERAAEILTEAYGPTHVWVAWSLSNRAMLHLSAGELDEAWAAQDRAHRIFAAAGGEDPAVCISAWRLARIHSAAGRFADAIDLLEPAIEAIRGILGEDHADVAAMSRDLHEARDLSGSLLTRPGRPAAS